VQVPGRRVDLRVRGESPGQLAVQIGVADGVQRLGELRRQASGLDKREEEAVVCHDVGVDRVDG
jgi:hypothetical protein